VKSTQAQINKHLERGIMKGAKATAAAIADVLRQGAQQGANEEGASGEQDEKMTPEYWAENLAMLAIRWSQEIIVEKTCIIYGAVATMLIDAVKSPHSLLVQLQLLAIFYGCEIFADLLFVFVLDGRFSVPLLRIPQPSVRSKQFWKDAAQGVIALLGCLFPLIYAHHSVTQWIGDGGGAGGGDSGGAGG
jgi:uncharacterized membrane protein YgcG